MRDGIAGAGDGIAGAGDGIAGAGDRIAGAGDGIAGAATGSPGRRRDRRGGRPDRRGGEMYGRSIRHRMIGKDTAIGWRMLRPYVSPPPILWRDARPDRRGGDGIAGAGDGIAGAATGSPGRRRDRRGGDGIAGAGDGIAGAATGSPGRRRDRRGGRPDRRGGRPDRRDTKTHLRYTWPMNVQEWVYGWDETPGIVAVWANYDGQALVWRRTARGVVRETQRFRPWLFATRVDDLAHLGAKLREDDPHAPFSYTSLAGPVASYCFLISARSGRALEAAVLAGAQQRLGGRTAARLNELPDYIRLGPVEQYLMASGRTYFRGLAYADLHRMQIDLETTALDPTEGRIFLVAVRDSQGLAVTLEAPTPDDEPTLINQLCDLIQQRDPDVIENHNLFGFDLPFLEARAALWRIPLRLNRAGAPTRLERISEDPRGRRHRYSVAGRELLDTLDAVRRHDFVARDLPSHRLKDVARTFGIASPTRTYLAGETIYATYQRDPELVRHYALDDVTEVDALSQRLHTAPFALAGMAPRRYERIAWAGPAMGILEPMLWRAYLRAGQAPPLSAQARAERQGGHSGGALFLFASGVARRVIKADIASLYPSLMRTEAIGPTCDRLGALLGIVSHLLEARLQHKAAARAAPPGSIEAGHHHALQAAMKLIINSAYGYMGATSIGHFADMVAADRVTQRGREVLNQVIAGMRTRGVALIEADTDGIYVAVPPGWDEATERALVAEVAAELPAGITLEYEGRYAAMFSHEVKNYALLGYDDQLILRGVAMRSSRSEPFGEQFLRTAIRLTMTGAVPALRNHFLDWIANLRERRVTAAKVATRVRLSKTPTQYRSSRAREGQYEALLAAGRTDWKPGERVRYYRTASGGFAWLPDDDSGERYDYDSEHYVRILVEHYAGRLRKAFRPADFAQIFRLEAQISLFDQDLATIEPIWIQV
ncbi:MAG: DNA polymerase domain-containing protein [Oscillochloridaceae bacterium umkhey_bin13]